MSGDITDTSAIQTTGVLSYVSHSYIWYEHVIVVIQLYHFWCWLLRCMVFKINLCVVNSYGNGKKSSCINQNVSLNYACALMQKEHFFVWRIIRQVIFIWLHFSWWFQINSWNSKELTCLKELWNGWCVVCSRLWFTEGVIYDVIMISSTSLCWLTYLYATTYHNQMTDVQSFDGITRV